jgi:hypothetical protein
MKSIQERLKENKENISASTLKTYTSLLKTLYYNNHPKDSEVNLEWFDNQDTVIESLKEKPYSSRKTTYAGLVAITKNNDKYKKALLEDGNKYKEFINTQTKTDKQEANWKSFEEIKTVVDTYYEKSKPLLKKKELDDKEYKQLQDFIILALTSGVFFSPRRSSDWVFMKIKNINKEADNYIDKNKFIFNKYKTAKFYNQQQVDIPKELKKILTKFIKLNPNDFLLTDALGKQLSTTRLTQKLNAIFGNKISTSMLRHVYLTDKLKDVPAINQLKQLAHDLGNSPMQALEYVKH